MVPRRSADHRNRLFREQQRFLQSESFSDPGSRQTGLLTQPREFELAKVETARAGRHELGQSFPDRRRMLEPVPRTERGDKDPNRFRMAIDDEPGVAHHRIKAGDVLYSY